jgi:hypothetical protein
MIGLGAGAFLGSGVGFATYKYKGFETRYIELEEQFLGL